MDWAITLIALVVLGGFTAFCGWKAGRPAKDSPNVQWISWPWLTVMAGAATAFVAVHAMSLLGFHTGQALARYGH